MRQKSRRRRGFVRRSAHALTAALAATVVLLAAPVGQQLAEACGCKKPAIRRCSPSLTMWKWCKRVYRTDEPVVLDFSWLGVLNPPCPPGVICIPCPPEVSTDVFFNVTPISGGPTTAFGAMTVTFVDGVISADTITITPDGGLPWTPGIYNVEGVIDVTLADGTVIAAVGDTCICIVEPSDADPMLPRLDLENITPDGPGGTQVHPGDAQSNTYVITNNRAVPCTVDLIGQNDQRGGVPGVIPSGAVIVDPFSFADPGPGDDYPIAFDINVPDPCLPLPALPQLATNSFDIMPPLVIDPFSSVQFDVHSRGWQLCETGSGCEQVLEGSVRWTDGQFNQICVGGVTISNSAVPPAYDCPDSGATVLWQPADFGGNPVLRGQANPRPTGNYVMDYLFNPPQILIDGQPFPVQLQISPATTDTCRVTAVVQFPAPEVPMPIDFFFAIDNFGAFPAQVLGDDGPPSFMPGLPTGFDHIAPTAKTALIIDENGDGVEDSMLMNLVQLQGEVVCDPSNLNDHGQVLDLTNAFYAHNPGFGFNTMVIQGQTVVNPCFGPAPKGTGTGVAPAELHFSIDIRSFAGGFPPNTCICDCDASGTLNIDDIDCFVAAFLGGDLALADCDHNGVINIDDIDCFVACFLAGCP